MLLIKGVMSAVSAGMLIYAATVEMIAGDFVFGDVEGGHHHHHEGLIEHGLNDDARDPDAMEARQRGRSQGPIGLQLQASGPRSSSLTLEGEGDDRPTSEGTVTSKRASISKRVLAVVSLFMGVGMMVVVALGE